jgi:DNA end-binding protein Ku
VTKDKLENISLESTRTIEIDEFVPRSEIDDLYLVRPYYLVPDGKVGHDAYAVIRETIRSLDKVAIARVVLTNREHIIALEARDKGLMGMLLRYPYEVRDAAEYFGEIQDVKITKDMLDLAKHIVEQKSGHFEAGKFEDHYEAALSDLLSKKQKGVPLPAAKQQPPSNVVNLMDALRASIGQQGKASTAPAERGKAKKLPGQKLRGPGNLHKLRRRAESRSRRAASAAATSEYFARKRHSTAVTFCLFVFLLRFCHRSFSSVLRSDPRP